MDNDYIGNSYCYRLVYKLKVDPNELNLEKPFIDNKTLNDKIIYARVNFQIYGYQDEWILFNSFTIAIDKQDVSEATICINKLTKLIRNMN